MAARENQGLQIALIIFVILTVLLIVTTFVFFRNYKEEQERVKDLNNKIAEKDKAAGEAREESREFKTLIGAPESDSRDAVTTAVKKEIETHGKSLAETDQNYRGLVKLLSTELNTANTRIATLTAEKAALADQKANDIKVKDTEIANYTQKLAKANEELQQERARFNQDRGDINQSKDEQARNFGARQREAADTLGKSRDQIAGLTSNVGRLEKDIHDMNEDIRKGQNLASIPDGKVTNVNQINRLVYVNLGSDDGLRSQLGFSVYSSDKADPAKAKLKGKIEVTKILGPHMAETRIVDDDLSRPIMRGDVIFNPAWEPGKAEHFALAGVMDVNGDKVSDREKIHDLIALNGGVIDAEVADDGTRTGKLAFSTKYLVLGDPPHNLNTEGETPLANYHAIKGEAQALGIPIIDMHKLLDYMGYKIEDRTVKLGKEASAADFKPRLPNNVQRTVPGNAPPTEIRRPTAVPRVVY